MSETACLPDRLPRCPCRRRGHGQKGIERRAEQAEPACIGREAPFQRKKYGGIVVIMFPCKT